MRSRKVNRSRRKPMKRSRKMNRSTKRSRKMNRSTKRSKKINRSKRMKRSKKRTKRSIRMNRYMKKNIYGGNIFVGKKLEDKGEEDAIKINWDYIRKYPLKLKDKDWKFFNEVYIKKAMNDNRADLFFKNLPSFVDGNSIEVNINGNIIRYDSGGMTGSYRDARKNYHEAFNEAVERFYGEKLMKLNEIMIDEFEENEIPKYDKVYQDMNDILNNEKDDDDYLLKYSKLFRYYKSLYEDDGDSDYDSEYDSDDY